MILSKTIKRVTAYIRYVMFRDERGEIENTAEHEYTINGVRYIVDSVFQNEENGKNTLKDRIKMILENEFSYLTSSDSGVTMATNDKRSSAEKEDNYADE